MIIQRVSLFLAMLFLSHQVLALDWMAVQDNEVVKSKCLVTQAPTKQEMQDFLLSRMSDPENLVNEVVASIRFQNEIPELIELFQAMHTNSFGKIILDNLKVDRCDKVLCVLEKNYGKEEALQMLYIQARFGLPTSPNAGVPIGNYQKWKQPDLETLITGLESLPPTLFPVRNHNLLRFLKGYTLNDYGADGESVMANARIDIFDPWFSQSKYEKISTLIHEFGHVVGFQNNLHDSEEWKQLAKNDPISRYAKTNAVEDFAESFLAYRFAPQKLKNVSEKKYQFIKNKVYNGLEFKDLKPCENVFSEFESQVKSKNQKYRELVAWSEKNQQQVKSELDRIKSFYPFEERAIEKCSSLYLSEVLDRSRREETLNCIKQTFVARAVEVEMAEQNLSDTRVLNGRFKDLDVSRLYLNVVRERLKQIVAKEILKIHNQEFYYVNGKGDFESNMTVTLKMMNQKESFLAQDQNKPVLIEIFKQILRQKGTVVLLDFRPFWSPNLEKILP